MGKSALRIGVSSSIMHADPKRHVYDGRPLQYVEESMVTWLMAAGVRPYLIPVAPEETEVPVSIEEMVAGLDGLVLQGGVDVAPETYGEPEMADKWPGDARRDAYELECVRACLALDRPLLAICRGHQILNVYQGGTLYQDISTQVGKKVSHLNRDLYEDNVHQVDIVPDSHLSRLYDGATKGRVNSVHHQAIKELGDDLIVEARSEPDGLIEAVRLDHESRYAVGVQWHPEFQTDRYGHLLDRFALLEEFVGAVCERVG
ncbi:MAG: gamma-glutamyl-gamma-aminobutyrate hydrolase family protein [Persicimonas sp.]